MALRDLTPAEWDLALVALDWALGPEAAELDLDLALEVRRLLRPGVGLGGVAGDAAWERAWRACCGLVELARERRTVGLLVTQEPLVLEALRMLKAAELRLAAR